MIFASHAALPLSFSTGGALLRTSLNEQSTFYWSNEPGSCPTLRSVDEAMMKLLVPDLHERTIFMCGPGPYMDAVKKIVQDLDFPMDQFNMESFGGVRSSTSNKSAPVGSAVSGEEPAPVGDISVEFAAAGVTTKTDGSMPLLDLAEENDVDIDYSCRSGTCGECKVRLLKGNVEMESDDGLEPGEKEDGYILACVARPKNNVVIEEDG